MWRLRWRSARDSGHSTSTNVDVLVVVPPVEVAIAAIVVFAITAASLCVGQRDTECRFDMAQMEAVAVTVASA